MRQLRSKALVADSQEVFGQSLANLLEHKVGFAKVLTTTLFAEATRHLISGAAFTLAVFDLQLTDMDGFASVSSLRISHPELRIAVSGQSQHREDVLHALSVGAHGYIPRSLSVAETVLALSSIASGQIYVPPTISNLRQDDFVDPSEDQIEQPHINQATINHLTARQHEVMMLIAQGESNKGIAQKLHLSEGTVKTHINALFRILNVHDRGAVAAIVATHIQRH
ncbi:response regulator transcription factor [Devosia crocina]|nr:response regulator transcription factor [Devosia crocina]